MADSTIQTIYTDGACTGNPGPGGWGVVIYYEDGSVQELGGAVAATTNNRMEMQAAIAALQYLREVDCEQPVTLYTDSEYLRNGITKWLAGWKKKNWKTSQGQTVLNRDLWELLDQLSSRQITWQYVRGHAGNEGNERCDVIARSFATGKPMALRQRSSETPLKQKSGVDSVSLIKNSIFDADATEQRTHNPLQSDQKSLFPSTDTLPMTDSIVSSSGDATEDLPREVKVAQLRNLIETLRIADEIAKESYLISSSELADLMDVNASAVTSRGDNWVWRNWVVSRVRREGNQILWQLERVDSSPN